jgi:HK97 gp10 family phage protein
MASTRLKLRITRTLAPNELAEQVKPKFTNLVNAMGRRAQRLAPKRTWALHDTISAAVDVQGSKLVGQVGAGNGINVNYALMVERGTSRMAAQPYLRPALLQTTAGDFTASAELDPAHGVSVPTRGRRK